MEISGRISERQHGFVKRRSCLTNVIEFFEEVTKMIDEGRAVDVVYMDFSKAWISVRTIPSDEGAALRKLMAFATK